jgi:hypothetical protein
MTVSYEDVLRRRFAAARPRPWTTEEVQRASDLRDAGVSYVEIAKELGRTPGAVGGKLSYSQTSGLRHHVANEQRPCDRTLAERDARAKLEHHTLTAAFCGDPLPGYSALDRRGSAP